MYSNASSVCIESKEEIIKSRTLVSCLTFLYGQKLMLLINCFDCQEVQFKTMDKYDFITKHHIKDK